MLCSAHAEFWSFSQALHTALCIYEILSFTETNPPRFDVVVDDDGSATKCLRLKGCFDGIILSQEDRQHIKLECRFSGILYRTLG